MEMLLAAVNTKQPKDKVKDVDIIVQLHDLAVKWMF